MNQYSSKSTCVDPSKHEDDGVMREIQETLNSAWGRIGLGLAALGIIAGASGCSPKEKSFWWGTFSDMPDPPAEARLQTGVSTESNGDLFINYVAWDQATSSFLRKDIHYTYSSDNPLVLAPLKEFRQAGGYEQRIKHGEVLTGGVIVDQERGVLILPGGNLVDGRTGEVITPRGTPLLGHSN